METNCLKWPQMGPGCVFPTNLDLVNILSMMDCDFDTFYFLDDCRSQISQIQNSWAGPHPFWSNSSAAIGYASQSGGPACNAVSGSEFVKSSA